MKHFSFRIIALILCFVILFIQMFSGAALAAETNGYVAGLLWQAFQGDTGVGADGFLDAIFSRNDPGCPKSSDGYHKWHCAPDVTYLISNCFVVECLLCGQNYRQYIDEASEENTITSSDLSSIYQDYVNTLPAVGIASDGSLLYRPKAVFVDARHPVRYSGGTREAKAIWGDPSSIGMELGSFISATGSLSVSPASSPRLFSWTPSYDTSLSSISVKLDVYFDFTAPLSGTYQLLDRGTVFRKYTVPSGENSSGPSPFYSEASFEKALSAGDSLSTSSRVYERIYLIHSQASYLYLDIEAPLFRIVPTESVENDGTYGRDTRFGVFNGALGVQGDGNTVTVVYEGSVVDEAGGTYTNPVTKQTYPVLSWDYDYSTRSYNLVFCDDIGTATVTYGDDKVTIVEYLNKDGQVDTATYYLYYAVQSDTGNPGSGSSNALSRVFLHYGNNITQNFGHEGHGGVDVIPTSGVADTVTAHSEGEVVWIQTGQTNNQGSSGNESYGNAVKIKHSNGYYTLYAHLATVEVKEGQHVYRGQSLGMMGNTGNSYGAHLHFEVRDTGDAKINPEPYLNADLPGLEGGGKSESDRSIWEKLGDFIGGGISGLLDLLGAVVSKLLDGLISLLGMLISKLGSVVSSILSVLDQLPSLFGGFLDLLGLLFPFLPPEITTLLTFGVIAVVVVWIIKAFLGR